MDGPLGDCVGVQTSRAGSEWHTKGQLISKWFFGVIDFLQETNENMSTWGIIIVKLNSLVPFLEEIDDQKTISQSTDL